MDCCVMCGGYVPEGSMVCINCIEEKHQTKTLKKKTDENISSVDNLRLKEVCGWILMLIGSITHIYCFE